jgi:phage gpG-like protein
MSFPSVTPQLLNMIGVTVRDILKRRIRSNQVLPATRKSNAKGQAGTTLVQSGRLMNSINYQVQGNQIIVGTNIKYARIHHEGGIITPTRAKYLAIPLTPAARVHKPRDFENTYIAKGVIFMKVEGGNDIALYALKKQVTIPERKYMLLFPDEVNELNGRIRQKLIGNSK